MPKAATSLARNSSALVEGHDLLAGKVGAQYRSIWIGREATVERARTAVQKVKEDFRKAAAPYRIACRKAGEKCEFSTDRSSNVSTQVSFAVEKTKKGIRVMVKGQPKTQEVIPFATLKESLNRAAYAYSDKHLGPKEVVGSKGGYGLRCSYAGSSFSSAGESRSAA